MGLMPPKATLLSLRSLKTFSALGVVAATALAVNANLLAARFYQRWDLTSERLYTLSQATKDTLHGLSEPVHVTVLLSRGDPLLTSVRHSLAAYGAESQKLLVRFLDPEQSPAEFMALQQRYGIVAGKADDGRLVTDASIIVAQGERHWYITPEDVVGFDEETGSARPKLEQALTSAIVNVLGHEKATICFSRGHQEQSLNDAGPEGLVELKERIEKSNYQTEERDAPGTAKEGPFTGCRLLVVAGPRLPFQPQAAQAVLDAVRQGMSTLLLLEPILGESGQVQSSGLEALTALAEVELERTLVIETDSAARLPRGLGEVFFATPTAHAVTQGLLKGGAKVQLRVLVSAAQSLRPTSSETKPLLVSSDQALAVSNVQSLSDGSLDQAGTMPRARRTLAVARELPKPAGATHPARLVLIGAGNVAHNRNFRDSGLYGDRILVENALSWLAARPALVSVPEKPPHEVGLSLSEDSLGEILRYVVIYMPGSAALIGLAVVLRRRRVEQRSRKTADGRGDDEART
jgi:hypothetical protein